MSRAQLSLVLLAAVFASACAGSSDRQTLASLREVEPDMTEVQVADGLDRAMTAYRSFLEQAPKSSLTPEAMRRLADLKLEKEYGILGDGDSPAPPAPKAAAAAAAVAGATAAAATPWAAGIADRSESESESEFERRAVAGDRLADSRADDELELPAGEEVEYAGPLEAIELYDQILEAYPDYEHNDQVLYQKARAYDELGRNDEAIAVSALLVAKYPHSRYIDEVQFRRGEYFFTRRRFFDAEEAYAAVTALGPRSDYYELALYKLGWALYKQEMHEEALQQYVELLDYKVSTGYDFDQTHDEADERRIADTYRVISLAFSNLGGPNAVERYFAEAGPRTYENRIYSHFGEFYLEKRRYHDAAEVYETFVRLYPLHQSAPHFGMRVVEIYEQGGFPKLVLESKKEFAATYGLQSEYWNHFDVADAPEVISYLQSNLRDLANHYHAEYQDEKLADEKPANFAEALRWYRGYLASFPTGADTPPIHHRMADLLLEHEDFGEAAREYERTAYEYPTHELSAAAGYAAIFAYRESEKSTEGEAREAARREAVRSTLQFVDTFPGHEHAAVVLVAAVEDLYDMQDFERAIATGQRLLESYPDADPAVRRSTWAAVGHASFDVARYEQAEEAYAQVLEMTAADDESRDGVVENLAAAIYKQGEQASLAEDHRLAADHFLRITRVAPTSEIRASAEYDAGAALIRLEDWAGAALVFGAFRDSHPDHELHREATKQMAFVYRKEGKLDLAAAEYERVSEESEDAELRREALLLAGELYEESVLSDRALAVYTDYVERFPEPLEAAVETRFKIAGMYAATGDEGRRREELRRIVALDGAAGEERTDRVRYLAAKSALVLAEDLFARFDEVDLVQPFDESLQEKQRRMDSALAALGELLDYEVGEVTAAATYYMAEVYSDFSQSLIESERPTGLGASELDDYELVLEEEAFPFEERAIEVHEKNLELMAAGVYGLFTEKSLEKLAVLMPGRYAKFEESSGLLHSIDRYAYRAPAAVTAVPGPEGAVQPEAPEVEESVPAVAPEAGPESARNLHATAAAAG